MPEAFHARFLVSSKVKIAREKNLEKPSLSPGSWRDWVSPECAANVDWVDVKWTGTSTLTQRNKMAALEDKAIWEDGEVILTAYFSAQVRYKCVNR